MDRQARQRASLTERLTLALLRLWQPFDWWYDDTLVTAWSARSATLVDAATAQSYQLSAASMRQALTVMRSGAGATSAPAAPRELVAPSVAPPWTYPRAAPETTVYSRPAEQYRYARSQGADLEEALKAATDRITALAAMDVQAADAHGAKDAVVDQRDVIGTRRIIHPELPHKHGVCGLCIVAADRIYGKGKLRPLHGGCLCTSLPITWDHDPGLQLNRDDLDRLYAAAGDNTGAALKGVTVEYSENGELGEIMSRAGQTPRAPAAVRKATGKPTSISPEAAARHQIEVCQQSLEDLLKRQASGNTLIQAGHRTVNLDLDTAISWNRQRISELTAKLGLAA